MIITKEVEICIVPSNIIYYKSIGIDVKMMKRITIPIDLLQNQSNCKIDVLCDRCGTQRKIKYQAYTFNIGRSVDGKIYTCDKCSHEKIKLTNIKRYGVEYFSKTEEFSKKVKKTSNEKFGVDHYSKTEEYIKKRDKTNIEKFGVKNPFQLTDIIKKSMIDKYGVEHPSQIEGLKSERMNKRRLTKENLGDWIKTEDRTEWEIYRNKVRTLTSKNIDIIFENWDGIDFYDGEYIKENSKLPYYNDGYPTIDHKISIFEGFNKKIDPIIISSIENLCITKRVLNIRKGKNSL